MRSKRNNRIFDTIIMNLEELIESYKIKIATLKGMIEAQNLIIEKERLRVKLGCYQSFLVDLERINSDK